MRVPDFTRFVAAENAAAAMSRGLAEHTESWGRLVASAQRIIAEVQNELDRKGAKFEPDNFYDLDQSAPLVAAARILDAAAHTESLDDLHRQRLAFCAAAAFSMYGNFPSAHAVIRYGLTLSESISAKTWFALGCFSPRIVAYARAEAIRAGYAGVSGALENLQAYLISAEDERLSEIDAFILESFGTCADNIESLLLGYAQVTLRQIRSLCMQRNLNGFETISPAVINRLLDASVFTLLPSQYDVLCRTPLLESPGNALVCLPTSTGKTLIGELAIASALAAKPGLAVFIAPYVAIGMQATRALKEHLPKTYRIHTMVGGQIADTVIDPSRYREVVVATPERVDAILRHYGGFRALRLVVVDEAHVVSDGSRGVRLEALLSRLRMQQQLHNRKFRILCLSAVMAESQRFRNWLGVSDELFITCQWRPTARRVAIWGNDNKLTWLYAGDELRPPSATGRTIFGTRRLVWPASMYPASDFARMRSQASALHTNAAFLCRQMFEEYQEPVLCVCASRASSRGVAYRLASDLESFEVVPDEIGQAITFIDNSAPHLAGLRECLVRGIAFHNAALPIQLRQLIERAVEKRHLKVVCATTTLAEGVDLPFRVTVLAEWLQWRLDTRDQQKPFAALKFRNIAGRSGRAGVFTEGDTVVFENVLGPAKFVDQQNRRTAILSMLSRPNEVTSALEEEVVAGETEARKHVLASHFLAAIPENPAEEVLDEVFANSLLAQKLPSGETVRQLTAKMRREVLQGGDMAFAKAASPISLTPIGEAANNSLFSPETCRKVIDALAKMPKENDFDEIASYLLIELGGVPEQHNPDWTKMVLSSGSRFVVKPTDLPRVIEAWRTGDELTKIFAELPAVRKSKAIDNVNSWLTGKQMSETWSDRFDKFSDFVGAVIEEFLPWVFDACVNLSPFLADSIKNRPWSEFSGVVSATIKARHLMDPSESRETA